MRPSFTASAEARLLTQELAAVPVGETVTYERMSEIVGAPIRNNPTALRTALRRALRDHDAVFGCVRGVGYKRLDDLEIVKEGTADADRIRRAANRSLERQFKVDFGKLPASEQARFSAQTAVLGAVRMMTKAASIAKVEAKVGPGRPDLPTAETLRLFTGEGTK